MQRKRLREMPARGDVELRPAGVAGGGREGVRVVNAGRELGRRQHAEPPRSHVEHRTRVHDHASLAKAEVRDIARGAARARRQSHRGGDRESQRGMSRRARCQLQRAKTKSDFDVAESQPLLGVERIAAEVVEDELLEFRGADRPTGTHRRC